MRSCLTFVVLAVLGFGCLDEDKGPEEALPEDGKADTQRKPTDHGAIGFGIPAVSALTASERYHTWTFELSGNAAVDLTTSYALKGQRRTDTVLYLYKEGSTGWGSYIARNDNYGSTVYSQLKKNLSAGRYRALVKGYSETTLGKFKLTVNCSGAGCASASTSCVFGDTYGDIASASALTIINRNVITAADLPNFTAEDQQHIVDAVKQSAHTDVTTPQEALSRVDGQEMNVTWIAEPAAQRMFIAFEYGAGDNSYGAIFAKTDGAMVTNIHDGDLEHCTTKAETCLLSEDWSEMRSDPAFTRTAGRVVTSASQLSALESQQALDTFRRTYYPDEISLADGFALIDGGQLNIASYTHVATGTRLTVFEHGAGDTSVGVIFYAGELRHAGTIDDLYIGNCTMFAH